MNDLEMLNNIREKLRYVSAISYHGYYFDLGDANWLISKLYEHLKPMKIEK